MKRSGFKVSVRPIAVALLGIAAVCTMAGCSGDKGPKLHPVRGQVLLDGKPVVGAFVTLHPEAPDGQATNPRGETGPDGAFQLTTFAANDGALPGTYRATVVCFRTPAVRNKREAEDAVSQNLLPVRYADPATSQLSVTVDPNSPELKPIALKR